ncbi:biotin synthase BioB [Achromobacter sp. F4_2707]|uniref:biotin synthase BioB n=1 Tax=Achromobacter sp. F4_2707 TaxID=3114286 RepID=UPI0039C68A31
MEAIAISRNTGAWNVSSVTSLFELPFLDLMHKAQEVHRRHHAPNQVQLSTLMSIKTGACTEDCAYCPQSKHHDTSLAEESRLAALEEVLTAARAARDQGAQRFCMGAAWRSPTERQLDDVLEMVSAVKALGMETCVTLGMLKAGQAERLREAGLDYYNHNLDTSPEFYGNIITTRTYQDRLDTLHAVREAGIKVCCGGIVGLGESRRERAGLLAQLANLNPYPESVPINNLVRVAGTPLADVEAVDEFEFVRTIAVARIIMPDAVLRLSAGRTEMSDATQALCFMAGANSIFYGDELLTTANPQQDKDRALMERLGLRVMETEVAAHATRQVATACQTKESPALA